MDLICAPLEHTRYAKYLISLRGEVAEWSKAAVLKTADPRGSGGSNPSLSARAFWISSGYSPLNAYPASSSAYTRGNSQRDLRSMSVAVSGAASL